MELRSPPPAGCGNALRRAVRLRLSHVPCRQHVGAVGAFRPHRMGVAPQFVLPVGDMAVGIQRRLDAHRHRRAIRLPGEFVIAHPLQPHRFVGDRAGEQRRIERDVIGAVLAVAARTFDMDATDILRRHLQRLDEFIAQREYALRMRPDDHPAVEERRHRAGRPDRAMRQIRFGVGRLVRASVGAAKRGSPA